MLLLPRILWRGWDIPAQREVALFAVCSICLLEAMFYSYALCLFAWTCQSDYLIVYPNIGTNWSKCTFSTRLVYVYIRYSCVIDIINNICFVWSDSNFQNIKTTNQLLIKIAKINVFNLFFTIQIHCVVNLSYLVRMVSFTIFVAITNWLIKIIK